MEKKLKDTTSLGCGYCDWYVKVQVCGDCEFCSSSLDCYSFKCAAKGDGVLREIGDPCQATKEEISRHALELTNRKED